MSDDLLGKYIRAAPIRVSHANLQPYGSGESAYRRLCPKCKTGALMVRRDLESLALTNLDNCTLCGQHFIYSDRFIGGEPVADVVKTPS